MRPVTCRIILAIAFLMLPNISAFAAQPDYNNNPVLAEFARTGTKIYWLGEQGGLNGWFLTKDDEIQIGYTGADNQYLMVGTVYDSTGNSITTEQIRNLYQTNPEARAFFDANFPKDAQQPATAQAALSSKATSPAPEHLLPGSAMSPGERLIQALQGASGVDLGAAAAPKLYMVADPNCPHCQATWKALRTAVFGGKLQIRIVPLSAVGIPDSERVAAEFLHSASPLDAWDKYIAGDHTQLSGTPDASLLADIRNNHILADSWHIQVTPYLTYRAKDGHVKILQGEPENSDSLVNDIAP